MSQKLVSIVLPTFNGEKFIAKSIESCLQQSYKNFELIIVDDCSADETPVIIGKYAAKDPRIRVVKNVENYRLPKSLNIGFTLSSGDYLTWTSDDNYYAPNALQKLIETLDKNPETDIVFSSYQFIDEKNNKLELYGQDPEYLLFKCIIGACFLYKRKVHEALNGYAEDKFRMEDMDFWLRAATKFRYQFIDGRNLYFYRKHASSLTSQIYSNKDVYEKYRRHHIESYGQFFNDGLNAGFSERSLQLHIEIYFEDLLQEKSWDFSLSEKLLNYLDHFDKLQKLDWEKVHFRPAMAKAVIEEKRKRILSLIINDIVFENNLLSGKNPRLASHINKPISWYYKEYEVLPLWYKRLGHIIKVLTGNRPFKSLFRNTPTQ